MAGSLNLYLKLERCSMSRTKRNGARPLTVQEALEMLQSAIGYCQQAGITVQAANKIEGLTLIVGNAYYKVNAGVTEFHIVELDIPKGD